MIRNKGQIWVETVIYTLIGVVLIGLVLAFAVPYIEEQKDRKIFDDTINALNQIDNSIEEVRRMGPGNQRQVDFLISEGKLVFDFDQGNNLSFELPESKYAASEIGRGADRDQGVFIDVPGTNLRMKTEIIGNEEYDVLVVREFADTVDLKFDGEDVYTEFDKSAGAYRFIVENLGRDYVSGELRINIYEVG